MKKQIIPVILAILMIFSGSIIPVSAAEKYGRVPILIGDAEADYVQNKYCRRYRLPQRLQSSRFRKSMIG